MVAWHPVGVVKGVPRVDLKSYIIRTSVATDVQTMSVQVSDVRIAVSVVGSPRHRSRVACHAILVGHHIGLACLATTSNAQPMCSDQKYVGVSLYSPEVDRGQGVHAVNMKANVGT